MNQGSVKANKILEINSEHDIFKALAKLDENDETINDYADLLYDEALLIAGLPVEDPLAYTKRINDLMLKAIKL